MKNLNSMTAYARHEQLIGEHSILWEIRSVNHRYLDAHFHLPDTHRSLEQALKAQLGKRMSRGRVDVNLSVNEQVTEAQHTLINQRVVKKWSKWQDDIHAVIPNAAPLSVMELISDGEVFEGNASGGALDEDALTASFNAAINTLIERRAAEGGRLQSGLAEKLQGIHSIVKSLVKEMPDYEQAHRTNWQAKLEKLQNENLDTVRLHQEVALLIAKADIAEELDRLESHISEFSDALQSAEPVGRRLDFLLQEFNREANTLGSKSIHKDITNASVEIKVLIDQLREQVQNIE